MTPDRFYELTAWVEQQRNEINQLHAKIRRLQLALEDAHKLIPNDLVGPWIMAHKLDEILSE